MYWVGHKSTHSKAPFFAHVQRDVQSCVINFPSFCVSLPYRQTASAEKWKDMEEINSLFIVNC